MPVNQTPANPASSQVNVLGAPGMDPGAMLMEQAKLLQQGRQADADRQSNMQLQQRRMEEDRQAREQARQDQLAREQRQEAFNREKLDREYAFKEKDATRAEDFANRQQQSALAAQSRQAELQRQHEAEQARLQREAEDRRTLQERERLEMLATRVMSTYGGAAGAAAGVAGDPGVGGMGGSEHGPFLPGTEPDTGGGSPLDQGPVPDAGAYTNPKTRTEMVKEQRAKAREYREKIAQLDIYQELYDATRQGTLDQYLQVVEKVDDIFTARQEAYNAFEGRIYKNVHEAMAVHLQGAIEKEGGWGNFLKKWAVVSGGPVAWGAAAALREEPPQSLEAANRKAWNNTTGEWEAVDEAGPEKYAAWALSQGGETLSRFVLEMSLDGITGQPMPTEEQGRLIDMLMAGRTAAQVPGSGAADQFKGMVQEYLSIPEDQRSLDAGQLDMLIRTISDMAGTGGEAYDAYRSGDELAEAASTGKVKETKKGSIDEQIRSGLEPLGALHQAFTNALTTEQRRQVATGGAMDPRAFKRGLQDWMKTALTDGDPQTKEQIVDALVGMGLRGEDPETGESWALQVAEEILLADDDVVMSLTSNPHLLEKLSPLLEFIETEQAHFTRAGPGPEGVMEGPYYAEEMARLIRELEGETDDLLEDQEYLEADIGAYDTQKESDREAAMLLMNLLR